MPTLSCRSEPEDQITVQVGPEETIRFEATSGFAHYYELPGKEDVLRIVLSSYSLSCEEYEPPEPGEVFITITVRSPSPASLETGTFAWKGLHLTDEDKDEESAPASDPQPSALPFVRLAQDARALPPGGSMKLTKFERETFGLVEGELAFRDAGPGEAATTALMGHFSVRLCHLTLDPTRQATDKSE